MVARGITFAPLTLHTGVSSLEGDEEPYPEPYDAAVSRRYLWHEFGDVHLLLP
jgi:S-adenosylmethionine:tRNA ribosyltransferase-isomerase